MTTTDAPPEARDQIPPGERRELRAVVRTEFKVLRDEAKQREAELLAEGEERLRQRYLAADKACAGLNAKIDTIVAAAQRKIDALIEASDLEIHRPRSSYSDQPGKLKVERVCLDQTARTKLRDSFRAAVNAQARTAAVAINRHEANLLRGLAEDGLKTEQGRAYLAGIPTVTDLLPSERLLEVEAAFDRGGAA